MRLKKILCGLLSALIMSTCLTGLAEAKPMKNILEEILKMSTVPQVRDYINRFIRYIDEESLRLKSETFKVDTASEIKRKDSVVFGIFCSLCYKYNWNRYIVYAAKNRDASEHAEDLDVLENIFPSSVGSPDGLKALCSELMIDVGDIIMTPKSWAVFIRFIDEISLSDKKISPCHSREKTASKKGRKFKAQEKIMGVDAVLDSTDTVSETTLSSRFRIRQKRLKNAASDLLKDKKPSKPRRKRNKPNCLSAHRHDGKTYDYT